MYTLLFVECTHSQQPSLELLVLFESYSKHVYKASQSFDNQTITSMISAQHPVLSSSKSLSFYEHPSITELILPSCDLSSHSHDLTQIWMHHCDDYGLCISFCTLLRADCFADIIYLHACMYSSARNLGCLGIRPAESIDLDTQNWSKQYCARFVGAKFLAPQYSGYLKYICCSTDDIIASKEWSALLLRSGCRKSMKDSMHIKHVHSVKSYTKRHCHLRSCKSHSTHDHRAITHDTCP